jgi:hypothetical protein
LGIEVQQTLMHSFFLFLTVHGILYSNHPFFFSLCSNSELSLRIT